MGPPLGVLACRLEVRRPKGALETPEPHFCVPQLPCASILTSDTAPNGMARADHDTSQVKQAAMAARTTAPRRVTSGGSRWKPGDCARPASRAPAARGTPAGLTGEVSGGWRRGHSHKNGSIGRTSGRKLKLGLSMPAGSLRKVLAVLATPPAAFSKKAVLEEAPRTSGELPPSRPRVALTSTTRF